MTTLLHVAEDLKRAAKCQESMHEAMTKFQAACMVKNWTASEEHRREGLAAMDAFFDNVAAANRAAQGVLK